MDSLVLKYLAWTLATYGAHLLFALIQVLLCAYLIASGIFALFSIKKEAGWLKKFGVIPPPPSSISTKTIGWLQLALGLALLLPVLVGAPFWFSLIASLISFFLIFYLRKEIKGSGHLARTILAVSAVIVFSLTLWEGTDLISVAKNVSVKAKYWRTYEKDQQEIYDPKAPKKGQMAHDFELADVTGTKTVRLSDFRGEKPVVMVLGSHT